MARSPTRNGILASRILVFDRVSRRVIVASEVRNARAIWAVERPATIRRVSAVCASGDRAGWQHPISRASWSSIRSCEARSGSCPAWRSSSGIRSRHRAERRARSMAFRRAVVSNHAPGRSGRPERSQRVAASTNASCTDSSAISRSPTSFTSVATSRGHSWRKTSVTPDGSRIGADGYELGSTMSGRTSTDPYGASGILAAHSIALSRSSTSIR